MWHSYTHAEERGSLRGASGNRSSDGCLAGPTTNADIVIVAARCTRNAKAGVQFLVSAPCMVDVL